VVAALSVQIAELEKQLNDTRNMPDRILIEIKAIFDSTIAKLQNQPATTQSSA
jgi:hypothetical protein